ncbi:MAG TPA: transglycosylase domain-containing protein, partial [Polyangiaceae bacterium]|nr:transglycosylase domain-containing protein [Polyangiaceae bacterium]
MESDEAHAHGEGDWEQEPAEPHPDDEPPQSNGPPSRWWRVFRWVIIVGFFFLGCGIGAVAYLIHVNSTDLPSVEQLKAGYNPPQITRVLARDNTLLKAVFTERRTVIPFEQIPNSAKLAFLAAEDAHFYEHEGLNYWGMLRALLRNVRAGHAVQGGSTITQQVVKNVLLDSSRTLRRKIRELILSRRLEQSLTKDEIFWLYLNHIYLGHGRYGIEEAARFYFGKKASELRVEEAATLAGLVAAPERFSPRRDAKRALERRRYVLDQMLEKGFITPELYAQVKGAPLHLSALG